MVSCLPLVSATLPIPQAFPECAHCSKHALWLRSGKEIYAENENPTLQLDARGPGQLTAGSGRQWKKWYDHTQRPDLNWGPLSALPNKDFLGTEIWASTCTCFKCQSCEQGRLVCIACHEARDSNLQKGLNPKP